MIGSLPGGPSTTSAATPTTVSQEPWSRPAPLQPLADRVLAGPIGVGERWLTMATLRFSRCSSSVKARPGDEPDSVGSEKIPMRPGDGHGLLHPGPVGFSRRERAPLAVSVERKIAGERREPDAGHRRSRSSRVR